jgi:26S proteasome regulatory subunit T6
VIPISFLIDLFFLINSYYVSKIEEAQIKIRDKTQNLERLTAQRNELNNKVRLMREELTMLHEPGSYVGEVVKAMGKSKVQLNPYPYPNPNLYGYIVFIIV